MKINFRSILQFIDQNILLGFSLFLLIFIPLYPKWPMFDVLPGYNVRVRLEDFLVLLACLIWFVQLLRGKIKLAKHPLFKPVAIYLVIGFLSTLSAIFITKTVTHESYQIMKLYFHLFRRVEYFSLLFIFFSGLYKKEQIKLFIGALITTVIGVIIYGFGQKYMYWPAYSTMNREFAKGIVLYLTEHARVLSTFGGHYDLAAYTMITLAILIPLSFIVKNKLLKILLFIVSIAEYWLLNLTASRTSFAAFVVSITVVFVLLSFKKTIWWALSRWLMVMLFSFAVMLTIGPMSERFSQVIKLDGVKSFFQKSFKKEPPTNGIAYRDDLSIEQQLSIVADKSDTPPSSVKPGDEKTPLLKPEDVYIDLPQASESATTDATDSATGATGGGGYSENALKYGLSTGIRLDALWPRAIAGFLRNPLLGSGYSTLVKEKVWEQTTAESTDNDFLRMLGETGLLGFITFNWIFILSGILFYKAFRKTNNLFYAGLFASGIGVLIGLIVNASYIDIFESSKVAYTMWSIIGVLTSLAVLELADSKKVLVKSRKIKND